MWSFEIGCKKDQVENNNLVKMKAIWVKKPPFSIEYSVQELLGYFNFLIGLDAQNLYMDFFQN